MLKRINTALRDRAKKWLLGGPPAGRTYAYDPSMDSARDHIAKGITFTKLAAILQAADDYDITDALNLFEEMESRDARLYSVAGTRRRAVTGLDWEIVSAAEKYGDRVDKVLAGEAAEYARETLDAISVTEGDKRLGGFNRILSHMATAIGPNLAVAELVWDYGELIEIGVIPHWRLTMRPERSQDVRVITADDRTYGVPARPPKFVVHSPESVSGSPLARSLCQAQAWLWLFRKLALADWATFVEIYGMPVRVGRYETGATKAERDQLVAMLRGLGTNAWAMISKNVELELRESGQRGVSPHEAFLNYLGKETSILWTGCNLLTDTTGGTGTHAAASVQDEIRDDIRDADLRAEADTVREQICEPMVRYKFPGREVPVPCFERTRPEQVDRLQEADLYGRAQKTGIRIPADYAYSRLAIPRPEDGEETLEPMDAYEDALTEGGENAEF